MRRSSKQARRWGLEAEGGSCDAGTQIHIRAQAWQWGFAVGGSKQTHRRSDDFTVVNNGGRHQGAAAPWLPTSLGAAAAWTLGAAAACPPGARTLGATAPPSLGAAVVARWSRVELPAVHEGGIEGRRSRPRRGVLPNPSRRRGLGNGVGWGGGGDWGQGDGGGVGGGPLKVYYSAVTLPKFAAGAAAPPHLHRRRLPLPDPSTASSTVSLTPTAAPAPSTAVPQAATTARVWERLPVAGCTAGCLVLAERRGGGWLWLRLRGGRWRLPPCSSPAPTSRRRTLPPLRGMLLPARPRRPAYLPS